MALLKTKAGKRLAAAAIALTMAWSILMGGNHFFSAQVATVATPAVLVADGTTPPPGGG